MCRMEAPRPSSICLPYRRPSMCRERLDQMRHRQWIDASDIHRRRNREGNQRRLCLKNENELKSQMKRKRERTEEETTTTTK
jgi:hypothetical protein